MADRFHRQKRLIDLCGVPMTVQTGSQECHTPWAVLRQNDGRNLDRRSVIVIG